MQSLLLISYRRECLLRCVCCVLFTRIVNSEWKVCCLSVLAGKSVKVWHCSYVSVSIFIHWDRQLGLPHTGKYRHVSTWEYIYRWQKTWGTQARLLVLYESSCKLPESYLLLGDSPLSGYFSSRVGKDTMIWNWSLVFKQKLRLKCHFIKEVCYEKEVETTAQKVSMESHCWCLCDIY